MDFYSNRFRIPQRKVEEKTPLILIEDIIINRTIEECDEVFDFVEEVIGTLTKQVQHSSHNMLLSIITLK